MSVDGHHNFYTLMQLDKMMPAQETASVVSALPIADKSEELQRTPNLWDYPKSNQLLPILSCSLPKPKKIYILEIPLTDTDTHTYKLHTFCNIPASRRQCYEEESSNTVTAKPGRCDSKTGATTLLPRTSPRGDQFS